MIEVQLEGCICELNFGYIRVIRNAVPLKYWIKE